MGDDNKQRHRTQRMVAETLAVKHQVGLLAGALCGRLSLEGRLEEAGDLARLLTKIDMVDGLEVDLSEALARSHAMSTLASAVVLRVLADGRLLDAQRLGVLFTMTKIGDADYNALVPSA